MNNITDTERPANITIEFELRRLKLARPIAPLTACVRNYVLHIQQDNCWVRYNLKTSTSSTFGRLENVLFLTGEVYRLKDWLFDDREIMEQLLYMTERRGAA